MINDEVLHEYVGQLLNALESPPGIASKSIAVAAGAFLDRHQKNAR